MVALPAHFLLQNEEIDPHQSAVFLSLTHLLHSQETLLANPPQVCMLHRLRFFCPWSFARHLVHSRSNKTLESFNRADVLLVCIILNLPSVDDRGQGVGISHDQRH